MYSALFLELINSVNFVNVNFVNFLISYITFEKAFSCPIPNKYKNSLYLHRNR